MSQDVIRSYENYREEDRLTTNNARRVEYLTTVRVLDALIPEGARLLDCAAGTGIYAMRYAARGCAVTALDLTPRHVDVMRRQLQGKPYAMETAVNDATDLSRFSAESFDAVLCMGPLYHLTDAALRARCLLECARVVRRGGLLAAAYINRAFIFPHAALGNPALMRPSLMEKLLSDGALQASDPDNFWTDAYFATPALMEEALTAQGFAITDHFAQDGVSPLLREKVDALDAASFDLWCDYHYRTCREPSLLGISNHGMVIGRKQR